MQLNSNSTRNCMISIVHGHQISHRKGRPLCVFFMMSSSLPGGVGKGTGQDRMNQHDSWGELPCGCVCLSRNCLFARVWQEVTLECQAETTVSCVSCQALWMLASDRMDIEILELGENLPSLPFRKNGL